MASVAHSMKLFLFLILSLFDCPALHELDPAFRKVTLENDRVKALVRDLKFHKDPVGEFSFGALAPREEPRGLLEDCFATSFAVHGDHEAATDRWRRCGIS